MNWGLVALLLALAGVFGACAPAAHAALTVPAVTITGSSTSAMSAAGALAQFEAAAGGADNGTTPGQQGRGFRHLTWDGVAAAGSTPIPGGHTVALARTSTLSWGLELAPQVAVASDGFASVNPHAGFPPFTSPNEWAPFNSNTATFDIVAPAAQGSAPVPAVTRGLGVVFLNVNTGDTTIQYYSGDALLGQATAPQGATSFAGVLFRDPVVTRVVITLGTAMMFGFDGTNVTPGGTDPNMLVAGDDVVLAEPGSGEPVITATAGMPFSQVLDSFNSAGSASEFRASIEWGDGTRSAGNVTPPPGGGLAVTGGHAYAQAGSYTATVTVEDFSGPSGPALTTQAIVEVAARATVAGVSCSPDPVAVSAGTTCVATVSDVAGAGTSSPTGLISFSTTTPGASFAQDGGCLLGPTAVTGESACLVQFTPGALPPTQARITAAYAGDPAHAGSASTAIVGVRAQRCSLRALSRKLRPAGLGVLVTCDARANVHLAVKAFASGRGRLKAFSLQFGARQGVVAAGRPSVLIIKPAPGVLKSLRAALHRHQRVSLKVTLTDSSHGATRTTTTRVPSVRLAAGGS